MDGSVWTMRRITLLIAGGSSLATMHFTSQLLLQHIFYWTNKEEQSAICIIICMAPVYALTSFFGLVDIQGSEAVVTLLDSIRECYEAVVIAAFLRLMYKYLKISTTKNIVPDEVKGRLIHHSFPITLFQPHEAKLDQKTLKVLQMWTWQFVIIRPALSILEIILQLLGLYEGAITWVVSIALNISVSLAMYSLITFYHAFLKELAPHKPLAKLLCIKGVVFFSFWQGVVLSLLAYFKVIRTEHRWLEITQIEVAYQNLFVCVEMVLFAVFQQYAFSAADYSGEVERRLANAKARREEKSD